MATVKAVRDAFVLTDIPTYHFYANDPRPDKYIIWGETSINPAVSADNKVEQTTVRGEAYFYTNEEYDEDVCLICETLNDYGVSWNIVNIGWDNGLRQIVYSFMWEIENGVSETY